MNFFTKIHELFRQKEQIVKKPDKHDANLQKNSTLYFQIGLIVCLLATNVMFEMYFETKISDLVTVYHLEPEEPMMVTPVIYKKPVAMAKTEPVKQQPRRLVEPPVVVKHDVEIEKPKPKISEPVVTTPKVNFRLPKSPVKKEPKSFGINNVSQAPIFPGCEKYTSNNERIECLSDKLRKHIQRKFNTGIAESKGLTGKQKIQVEFTVDNIGNVTNIKTRSPHPALDKEAKHVISKVPQMKPGRHNDKNVSVRYYLPIVFQVQY